MIVLVEAKRDKKNQMATSLGVKEQHGNINQL